MQAQQQVHQPVQRIIMLPSRHVPQSLVQQIADLKDFSVRFINGYRNILQPLNQNELQWGLVENEDYCGQAYSYLLKDNINKEQLLKRQVGTGHVIRQVSDQMFVVQSTAGQSSNEITITVDQLRKLITQVTESKQTHNIAINLVKNAFSSYQSYQKSVSQAVQKIQQQLESQQEQKIPTVAETITLEDNAKKLSGDLIKTVPKCNRETGLWDQGETIEIKLNAE